MAAGKAGVVGDGFVRGAIMRRLYGVVEKIARGTISVLVLGETGVGKDVVATAVHERSARRAFPFVRLNCATLSESLLESELFGYQAGAFTGARSAKAGLLELADKGTVLLDEVAEMPLSVQAKLLRATEACAVMRLGGTVAKRIDVRYVAATNRDLAAEVRRGTFREDLYFRLAGAVIRVPPLRDRRDEIEPLAARFAEQASAQLGCAEPFRFEPEVLRRLLEHRWPGNVRELRNAVERAVLLADEDRLGPSLFDLDGDSSADAATQLPAEDRRVGRVGRAEIEAALAACAGNQTRAAKLLGIARRTLVKKLARLDVPRPRSRAGSL
jgi:two-component system response regulator AtoC